MLSETRRILVVYRHSDSGLDCTRRQRQWRAHLTSSFRRRYSHLCGHAGRAWRDAERAGWVLSAGQSRHEPGQNQGHVQWACRAGTDICRQHHHTTGQEPLSGLLIFPIHYQNGLVVGFVQLVSSFFTRSAKWVLAEIRLVIVIYGSLCMRQMRPA